MSDIPLEKLSDEALGLLLVKAFRLRRDVGHFALSRYDNGQFQASFKARGDEFYQAEIDADPVLAIIRVIGPKKGETPASVDAAVNERLKLLALLEPKRQSLETDHALVKRLANTVKAKPKKRPLADDFI